MKTKVILALIAALFYTYSIAQVAINADGSEPNGAAMLDIKSTDKGILIPRMTSAQRNAIALSTSGLLVYDLDTESFWYYNNATTQWVEMGSGGVNQFGDLTDAIYNAGSYFLGTQAGINANANTNNFGFADYALESVTDGTNNLALGKFSQKDNVTGWNNVAIGSNTLRYNTTGSYNTVLGNGAGSNTTGGSFSGCVMIGHQVGINNTENNKLYIDNSGTATPLIGGDFSDDRVDINGTIKITGGNPGAGKILTSDADGNASWESAGAAATSIDGLSDAINIGTKLFMGTNAGINNTGTYNTGIGYEAMKANLGGSYNTALGYKSLDANTEGDKNAAFGHGSLTGNTTGAQNTALGTSTLDNNTEGNSNVAVGYRAQFYNTTGYSNVAIGVKALEKNTYQHNIVAIGDSALYKNGTGGTLSTHGSENTAIGSKALYANTLGDKNTAVGIEALNSNTEGRMNTAVGAYTLQSNTSGEYNTAVGPYALILNTTGADNTAMGYKSAYNISNATSNAAFGSLALYSTTTGSDNSAFGRSSLFLNVTGNENTVVGYRSMYNNVSGYGNIAIGHKAGYNSLGDKNIFIGKNAGYYETGSEKLYIDNSSTDEPLIYGEFDNNLLKVNGDLAVSEDITTEEDFVATGDYKYAASRTKIFNIPAAAFSLFTNQDGDKAIHDDNGYWHISEPDGNGAITIKAPVNLPDGAVITRFSYYYRNDGEYVQVRLRKKGKLSLTSDEMAFTACGASFDLHRIDDYSINNSTIDNTNNYYFITAYFLGADDMSFGHFHGAEIEYTIDKID